MLIRREVFEKVNGFREDYFMYAEDIDLSYRIKRAGFRNYYVGAAQIIHYGGKSSGQQRVSHWSSVMKCRAVKKLFDNTRGKGQGSLYRVVMGAAAMARLGILTILYPFGDRSANRNSFHYAMGKWMAVLCWAFGLAQRARVPERGQGGQEA